MNHRVHPDQAVFLILLPAVVPPTQQAFLARLGGFEPGEPGAGESWVVTKTDPRTGARLAVVCREDHSIDVDSLVVFSWGITEEEKRDVLRTQSCLYLEVESSSDDVLRTKKDALRCLLPLMEFAAVAGVDVDSQRIWSRAAIEDELLHDADLDVESLYVIHAVSDSLGNARWVHTHGLGDIGALDIDILRPSPECLDACPVLIHALAFQSVLGTLPMVGERFALTSPGSDIRMVYADEFDQTTPPDYQDLRDLFDDVHTQRRVVLCNADPVRRLLRKSDARPVPWSVRRLADGQFAVNYCKESTNRMADRAKKTIDVFRKTVHEFEDLRLPALVKLGYTTDAGSDREHLWFDVHGISREGIDATLVNQPFDVSQLKQGQRGVHPLTRISDWTIQSPAGPITPREMSAIRTLRVHHADIALAMREAGQT